MLQGSFDMLSCRGAGVGDVMFRSPAGPYTVIPGDAVAGTIAASMAATAAGLTDRSGPHITQSCTSISNPLTLGAFVSLVCRQCRWVAPSAAAAAPCLAAAWPLLLCVPPVVPLMRGGLPRLVEPASLAA